MARAGPILRAPAAPRSSPAASPFLDDARELASGDGTALTTRHLVLSAWRQMRGRDAAHVVPSRLLLDLAGGDRVRARALYAEVLADLTADVDSPPGPSATTTPAPDDRDGPDGPDRDGPLRVAARWVLT